VVTEPAKAVSALKGTVREMERRYRLMTQLAVRNIGGYNDRVETARAKGELITRRVQTGFDSETGKPTFEEQALAPDHLPFIVVVIDEMADLMMVAGANGARCRHSCDHGDATAIGGCHYRRHQGQFPHPGQLSGNQQIR
jgi:DNA segregation ATPase FtsK/SpoIIIE-like protein